MNESEVALCDLQYHLPPKVFLFTLCILPRSTQTDSTCYQ